LSESPSIIGLGADHAGRDFKKLFKKHLALKGYQIIDFGVADDVLKADYPEIAGKVAKAVKDGTCHFGVLICGTGAGMAMAANRYPGVRAASCPSQYVASLARAHNDANILTLGQRVLGPDLALAILDTFLTTSFEGGRHQNRVEMMG
jgi:ribose 5-phosphate isomerase B